MSTPPEASARTVEAIVSHADAAFLHFSALNAHHVAASHRALHSEHHAGKHRRKTIEQARARAGENPRRERVAATLAQIRRKLEDEIVARALPERSSSSSSVRRALRCPRHFEHSSNPPPALVSPDARAVSVEREIWVPSESRPCRVFLRRAVVAEPRRVERELHVARKADPAAACRDFTANVLGDAIAVLARVSLARERHIGSERVFGIILGMSEAFQESCARHGARTRRRGDRPPPASRGREPDAHYRDRSARRGRCAPN